MAGPQREYRVGYLLVMLYSIHRVESMAANVPLTLRTPLGDGK